MMFAFSKRFMFWFLLVVSILLIFYGVAVALATVMSKKIKANNIVFGVLDIIIGICGIIGVFKRNRVLLTVYAGLQVLQLLMVIVSLIVQPFIAAYMVNEKISEVKKSIIKNYGSEHESKFTAKINGFQVKHSCCHFFGNSTENVFLKTPWYIAENHGKPAGHTMRTLPDSCCVRAEDPCRFATDVKEAITKGAVVSQDCSDTYSEKIHRTMAMVLVFIIVAVILQIPIVLVTAIGLYQNKYFFFQEEADFTDEPVTE